MKCQMIRKFRSNNPQTDFGDLHLHSICPSEITGASKSSQSPNVDAALLHEEYGTLIFLRL